MEKKDYSKISEYYKEFSTYTIPEDPKEILEYLLKGDENSTEKFSVFREFILSQIHVDLHFNSLIEVMNGRERMGEIYKFSIPNTGVEKTGSYQGKNIFDNMISGNFKPYEEF